MIGCPVTLPQGAWYDCNLPTSLIPPSMTQTVRAAVLAAMGRPANTCGVLFFVFDNTTDQATLSDEEIARALAVMLLGHDDPGITCVYWGPNWIAPAGGAPDVGTCVSETQTTCNACDDGQGGCSGYEPPGAAAPATPGGLNGEKPCRSGESSSC